MTKVLIVDDREDNLLYLRSLLSGHGFVIESARHGGEALATARAQPPDVVVSDLLMPVMDGYTCLRHWKVDPALKRIPFVVYTATYTEPEDEELALRLGADAFILKPVAPDEFVARLRAVLKKEGPAAPAASKSPPDEAQLLREYSEILIRKLEQKALELEETNRSLESDIAARAKVEAALRKSIDELKEAEARLRRTEEELRHAQKMEAMGRLAGGVAHDFNNVLSVILTYTTLVLDSLAPDAPIRDDLLEVRRAGERAAALTRQLLAFSRRQVVQPSVVVLAQIVADMKNMLLRLMGEDVEVTLRGAPDGGRVLADPGQIEQIVMNLAVNARDAMPLGGKLEIETANVDIDARHAADRPSAKPGAYVALRVTDSGTGMEAATMARIFEPFFTTKEQGKGTGLGLSTVFGIVMQSGGHIFVDSAPGCGTKFEILFPRTERAVAPRTSTLPERAMLNGSETILLVDDDESVRSTSRAILERNGYTVIDAPDGQEALDKSATFAGTIDLLLTDVVMPRLNGRELAERLAKSRPRMRILYVSGYADAVIAQHGALGDEVAFLQKPITPDSLLRRVREVLSSR